MALLTRRRHCLPLFDEFKKKQHSDFCALLHLFKFDGLRCLDSGVHYVHCRLPDPLKLWYRNILLHRWPTSNVLSIFNPIFLVKVTTQFLVAPAGASTRTSSRFVAGTKSCAYAGATFTVPTSADTLHDDGPHRPCRQNRISFLQRKSQICCHQSWSNFSALPPLLFRSSQT